MSLYKLKKYIEAIDQDSPINLFLFKKLVYKQPLSYRIEPSDIIAEKFKNNLYKISYINKQLENELRHLIDDIGVDRNTAARQNLSHSHKVDGSFMVVRQLNKHPQVVTIDSKGIFNLHFEQSKKAILLENRQLFIHIDKVYKFIKKYTQIPCDQPLDYIFGTGNECSNSLHAKFLSSYEHLYLCFDLDLGGLSTARNLYRLLPSHPMTFVQPIDIYQRLKNVKLLKDTNYLEDVALLGQQYSSLRPFTQLIVQLRRTIEQESFLNE